MAFGRKKSEPVVELERLIDEISKEKSINNDNVHFVKQYYKKLLRLSRR